MAESEADEFDVVIVGAGVAGSIIAGELGRAGKRVLVLEAGAAVPTDRSAYMENFYGANAKTPESPYPPLQDTGDSATWPGADAVPRATILGLNNWKDPSKSYLLQPDGSSVKQLPFASTYERVGGGTTWHWLGTSLRLVPNDLKMHTTYGVFDADADWPLGYDELERLYGKAEAEIGVSASVEQQAPLREAIGLRYPSGYQYPMQPIPPSLVDASVSAGIDGMTITEGGRRYPVFVTSTPAGRNSQPYQNRRVCAGNTNCIPICPIQAKWDATVALNAALNTGKVEVRHQSVAKRVIVGQDGRVSGIEYIPYAQATGLDPHVVRPTKIVRAGAYVLAAHAIENPKLLLNSRTDALPTGVANRSGQLGCNLMDHVLFLSWALTPVAKPVFGYRGPLSTSGIESLRDGAFRRQRAAFRIEIGNEGWNFPIGDPYVTVCDFVDGTNNSRLNPLAPPGTRTHGSSARLGGAALVQAVNDVLSRQFRMACLIEQSPSASNRVGVDPSITDGLGIPRPRIAYGFDAYTLGGFRAARATSSAIYQKMGAIEFTDYTGQSTQPGYFELDGVAYRFFGAGHIMGTHRMGNDPRRSVVDADQRSHDHRNLWIVGSGSFPTVGTPNPTLTIAALAFKTAASVRGAA